MWRAIALSALMACAPSRDAALPEPLTARTHLLATLDDAGTIARLEVFDPARLPVTMRATSGVGLLILAFDAPLASLVAPSDDVSIEILAVDTDPDIAWELAPPAAAWELAPGDADLKATDATSRLAALRVRRPPCPTMVQREIPGLVPRSVRFAVRWGDDIWAGTDEQAGLVQQVFRIDSALGTATEIAMPPPRTSARVPLAFVDEPHLWVLWQSAPTHDSLLALDREGRIIDTLTPTTAALDLDGLAGARIDGARTVIARSQEPADFFALDEQTLRWVRVARSPADCDNLARSQIIEITGPRKALIGIDQGQIVSVDLDQPDKIGAPYISGQLASCRSARTTLSSGVEMVAYQQSVADETLSRRDVLLWRLPGGPWQRLGRKSEVSGKSIGAIGDLVIIGGTNDIVLLYQYVPERPNLPPRYCGQIGVAINVLHILAVDEDTGFIGGLSGPAGLFIDLVR